MLNSYGPEPRGHTFVLALFGLAEAHLARHRFTGSDEDLNSAINLHNRWFGQGDVEHFYRDVFLHDSAVALIHRFLSKQHSTDLANAIQRFEAALTIRSRDDHQQCYATMHELATCLQLRFQLTHSRHDMDKAIELQESALSFVPQGHPDRSRVLFGLSRLRASSYTPYHDLGQAL
jgi:hypothetical protein